MRVGSELKAARKKAGITVEVISKRTKIQVSKLVALEKNDFTNLPTGLYLFGAVRAYAREVHIDPEPIVERLRTEFADKDALDALHALDATGALDAKNPADPVRSKDGRSNLLRNAAIAAGVVLMAAAGTGAGAYLHSTRRIASDVRSETPSASLSSPPATPAPTLVVEPQKAASAAPAPAPTKTNRTKPRPAAVTEEPQETVAAADTSAMIEDPAPDAPVIAPEP